MAQATVHLLHHAEPTPTRLKLRRAHSPGTHFHHATKILTVFNKFPLPHMPSMWFIFRIFTPLDGNEEKWGALDKIQFDQLPPFVRFSSKEG